MATTTPFSSSPFSLLQPRKHSTTTTTSGGGDGGGATERAPHYYYSSVRCFQSKRCGGDCAEPLNLQRACTRSAAKCDSRLLTRTCVYENLYFRSRDRAWMYFADAEEEEKAENNKNTNTHKKPVWQKNRVCTTMLRDYYPWAPKLVFSGRKPPSLAAAATLNRTVHVEQKYHSSFGHALTEQLFGTYWQAAEAQGTWEVDPSSYRLFYDGHLMDTPRMWGEENDEATGRPKTWLRHVLPLLFDFDSDSDSDSDSDAGSRQGGGGPLHPGHSEMHAHAVTRVPWLVVGGYGGRSPYDAATYVPFSDLAKRPPQRFDDEYGTEEKAAAFMHYADFLLARGIGVHRRSPPLSSLTTTTTTTTTMHRLAGQRPEDMQVVFMARPRSERRFMTNYVEVFRALKKRFKQRIVKVMIGHLPLPDLMRLFSNTSLLVSPHGSHNSNIKWLPVGAALVELHPSGCDPVKGYDTVAELLSLRYEGYDERGKGGCSPSMRFRTEAERVASAVAAAHERMVEGYDAAVARAKDRWRRPPRRTGGGGGGGGGDHGGELHFDPQCDRGRP